MQQKTNKLIEKKVPLVTETIKDNLTLTLNCMFIIHQLIDMETNDN